MRKSADLIRWNHFFGAAICFSIISIVIFSCYLGFFGYRN
jgi:hypothetical protein